MYVLEMEIMNSLVRQFFSAGEKEEVPFSEILFLDEGSKLSWEEASKKSPDLPRGWYELSRVAPKDRVEFTRDYWLDRLPYHPSAHPQIYEFFEQLDDVAVVLARPKDEEAFVPELVYSLEDDSTFFRGRPPCSEEDLFEMRSEIRMPLPNDYMSFVRIHSGFGKLSEMGLLPVGEIGDAKRRVLEMVTRSERSLRSGSSGNRVDPGSLIPFYEAVGLSCFQCFYADWYPGNEMGNVYLSGIDYTISDTTKNGSWAEGLAFATFLEWLAFYLQGMNVSP